MEATATTAWVLSLLPALLVVAAVRVKGTPALSELTESTEPLTAAVTKSCRLALLLIASRSFSATVARVVSLMASTSAACTV